MSKVIFSFEKIDTTMACSKDELMKNICEKFANFIGKDMNSLRFSYNEKQLNFNLSFEEQANETDKGKNEMKIFVYKDDDNQYKCPKCGEKIKFNKIDKISSSMNNLKDSINGIKLNINNIIRLSSDNTVNIQLKNINIILNGLNDDIKKINEEINHLPNNDDNNIKKETKNENVNNYILAEFNIKEEDVNKKIHILNCYDNTCNPFLKNESKKDFNGHEIQNCEIEINGEKIPFNYYYQFKSKGNWTIKYSFRNIITNASSMFSGCDSLKSINFSNFNSNNITKLASMFDGCSSLTNINLYNFNTSKVTDMQFMFKGCKSLTHVNLSSFNTRNTTNMGNMFEGCSSLININLSSFNTCNTTNMAFMFKGCSSLTNINLSNFNTENTTNMAFIFKGCSSLTNINLSNFNTVNTTNMRAMFEGCCSLTNINLSNFNTANTTDMKSMFEGCSCLTNINLSNFNTHNVIDMDNMFAGCESLKKQNIFTKDERILNEVNLLK